MRTLRCPVIASVLRSLSAPAWVALIAASVALGRAPVAGQDLPDMPSFQEVLSLQVVGGVAISPDGARVAYTVRSSDWEANRVDTEIWLAAEGEPFQLTRTADGSSSSPQWSPDGRWLSFLADRGEQNQVHLIDPRGGEAWAVTEVEEGVTSYRWAPTGDRILLRVREPETDEDKARSEQYGTYAVEDEEYRNSHLWVLEIDQRGETTEPERLTEGDFHVADAEWSPDARHVAYVRQPNANLLSFMETDIYILDMESKESRDLVTGPGPDSGPEWSPDGGWILFSEFDKDLGSLYYLNGEFARIPAAGGEIEILTGSFDEDPFGATWTDAGIRFMANDRTERKVYTLDPDTRAIAALPLPTPIVGSWDFTPMGRRWRSPGRAPRACPRCSGPGGAW